MAKIELARGITHYGEDFKGRTEFYCHPNGVTKFASPETALDAALQLEQESRGTPDVELAVPLWERAEATFDHAVTLAKSQKEQGLKV